MNDMTQIQSRVLAWLKTRIQMNSPPSIREVCAQFGWRSSRSGYKVLVALEKKRKIKRVTGAARSFVIL